MTVVCLSRTVHFLQQYPSFVRLLQHTLLFSYFFEKCRPAQQTRDIPKVGSMLDQRRGQHWTKFWWTSRVCWVGTKLVCLPIVFSFRYKAKEIAESLIGDNTTTGEIYIRSHALYDEENLTSDKGRCLSFEWGTHAPILCAVMSA